MLPSVDPGETRFLRETGFLTMLKGLVSRLQLLDTLNLHTRETTSTARWIRDDSNPASITSVTCRAVRAFESGGCVPARMQSTQC